MSYHFETTRPILTFCSGTDEQNTTIAACGVPVNEYFWLNTLHPTFPVHEVVADQLSQQLSSCTNCTSAIRKRWQLTL